MSYKYMYILHRVAYIDICLIIQLNIGVCRYYTFEYRSIYIYNISMHTYVSAIDTCNIRMNSMGQEFPNLNIIVYWCCSIMGIEATM